MSMNVLVLWVKEDQYLGVAQFYHPVNIAMKAMAH